MECWTDPAPPSIPGFSPTTMIFSLVCIFLTFFLSIYIYIAVPMGILQSLSSRICRQTAWILNPGCDFRQETQLLHAPVLKPLRDNDSTQSFGLFWRSNGLIYAKYSAQCLVHSDYYESMLLSSPPPLKHKCMLFCKLA